MEFFLEKAKIVMIILTLVILIFSSLMGIYKYLVALFSKISDKEKQNKYLELRIFISESLILSLTFLLGADIIESILNSNLNTLLRLIVVFLFRLVMTYFLDNDIKKLSEEKNES